MPPPDDEDDSDSLHWRREDAGVTMSGKEYADMVNANSEMRLRIMHLSGQLHAAQRALAQKPEVDTKSSAGENALMEAGSTMRDLLVSVVMVAGLDEDDPRVAMINEAVEKWASVSGRIRAGIK